MRSPSANPHAPTTPAVTSAGSAPLQAWLTLLGLALRNLRRNLRRTLITATAIGGGLGLVLVAVNMNEGTYKAMMDTAISAQAGHVVIQAAGYQADPDPLRLVAGARGVAETARAVYPEARVVQRSRIAGLLTSPANAVGAGLLAIEPSAERAVTDTHTKLSAGEWLADDDDRGVVLGEELARRLKVGVGDKVVLMAQGEAEVSSRLLRVRGLLRTGAVEIDAGLAVTTLACAQAFLERPDTANQISLHLPSAEGTGPMAASLAGSLARAELEVLDWEQALPEVVEFIRADRVNNAVTMGIIGIIVAIGVLNTVLMSVMERIREFGVMLALGLPPRQIAALIVLEGTLLGAGAAAAGLLLGVALSWPLVTYGLDYSDMLGSESFETAGVVISSTLFATWDVGGMAGWTLAAWLMTILSTLWPAWTAARLSPVDAMRHV